METKLSGIFNSLTKTFIVCILLVSWGVVGCAPTVREVSKETIQKELLEKARREGKKEGFQEGLAVGKAQMQSWVQEFIKKYGNEMLYLKMVHGGVLKPGQVSMFYKPPTVSEDGSTFSSPRIVWKVVSPPQFDVMRASSWYEKDKANFCYFVITTAKNLDEATHIVGTIKKPDNVFVMSVPFADKSSQYAVIGKTPVLSCEQSITYFKKQGYDVLKISE